MATIMPDDPSGFDDLSCALPARRRTRRAGDDFWSTFARSVVQ